jgi:lysophospholipase L1-like esterase
MARIHIAALGSSFAAGPSIQPEIDTGAGRSARNYPHQLAEKLDAELTDLTVSGATLRNVYKDKQMVSPGSLIPPQIRGLPSDVDIITLTGGGNDISYVRGMLDDSMQTLLNDTSGLPSDPSPLPPPSLQVLTDRFVKVIDDLHEIAPRARILLVEYLTLIGNHTKPAEDVPLRDEQLDRHRSVATVLCQAYANAAQARPFVELIPVARLSQDHALGSGQPWVEGFRIDSGPNGPVPFHPNLAGHTAVAEILYKYITSGELPLTE